MRLGRGDDQAIIGIAMLPGVRRCQGGYLGGDGGEFDSCFGKCLVHPSLRIPVEQHSFARMQPGDFDDAGGACFAR